MPRRTAKQRKKEGRIAAGLVALVLLAVFTAVLLAVPGAQGWLFSRLGITKAAVPVVADGGSAPVGVHIIDVGQGSAALIEDGGEFALIDAGTDESTEALLAYLHGAGVRRLRYVFMTHPHADHIGGMQAVVESIEVEQVVLPRFELEGYTAPGQKLAPLPTTSTFEKLLEAMTQRKTPTVMAAEGQAYPLGTGSIQVVHAGLPGVEDYNLISLGLLYKGDGLRFLCTGDGEDENEKAMLNAGADVQADVFVAGHHGSHTSNTAAFVRAVSPAVVVISCGQGNSYGHPHQSALASFAAAGALVLRCDTSGSVVLRPDGQGGIAYATAAESAA